MDNNGNVTVAWISYGESDEYLLQTATKLNGVWQEPVTISLPDVNPLASSIAADNNGTITVAWVGRTTDTHTPIVQVTTKSLNEPWQEPITLAQHNLNGYYPQIAVDNSGNATVLWGSIVSGSYVVQASTRLQGTWQLTPDTIPGSQQMVAQPKIAGDGMGNVTAVWSNDTSVLASTKSVNGTWQPIPDVLSLPTFSLGFPDIAMDDSGNAVVVWMEKQDMEQPMYIQAVSKPFGGLWQPSPDILSPTNLSATSVQVAMDGSGNATAIWSLTTENGYAIQSATTSIVGLTVKTIVPTSGPTKGKNTVTITGTNFVDVTAVYFGSTPSPSFTVVSPLTIVAVVPPGKGTVDVTVTAESRTSPVTPADQYTYRRFKGKIKHYKKKLLVKTKWNKTVSTNAIGYEIFARNKKIATIPSQDDAQAIIHLHPHHAHHEISKKYRHYLEHKYKTCAIDNDGMKSAFTFLNLPR